MRYKIVRIGTVDGGRVTFSSAEVGLFRDCGVAYYSITSDGALWRFPAQNVTFIHYEGKVSG